MKDVLGLTSILIAVCALILTVIQSIQNRKHNRLSVKPILEVNHHRLFTERSIVIKNVGLGPAVINKCNLLIDGIEREITENIWDEFLSTINLPKLKFQFYSIAGHTTFEPGQMEKLLYINCSSLSNDILDEIDLNLKRISFIIKYRSVYNEKFEIESTRI